MSRNSYQKRFTPTDTPNSTYRLFGTVLSTIVSEINTDQQWQHDQSIFSQKARELMDVYGMIKDTGATVEPQRLPTSFVLMYQEMAAKTGSHEPFPCGFCLQTFASMLAVKRHEEGAHLHLPLAMCEVCPDCHQSFRSTVALNDHRLSTHPERFQCWLCDNKAKFASEHMLHNHLSRYHPQQRVPITCGKCGQGKEFDSYKMFVRHLVKKHRMPAGMAETRYNRCMQWQPNFARFGGISEVDNYEAVDVPGPSWAQQSTEGAVCSIAVDPEKPTEAILAGYPHGALDSIKRHWKSMRTAEPIVRGDIKTTYQIRLDPQRTTIASDQIKGLCRTVFQRQSETFRLSLRIGTLMHQKSSEDQPESYKICWAGENSLVTPLNGPLVDSEATLEQVLERHLNETALTAAVMSLKKTSRSYPHSIVSVCVDIVNTGLAIGCANTNDIWESLTLKHGINALLRDANRHPYNDHLCAFRCAVLIREGKKQQADVPDFEDHVDALRDRYFQATGLDEFVGNGQEEFRGVPIRQFPLLERIALVQLNCYMVKAECDARKNANRQALLTNRDNRLRGLAADLIDDMAVEGADEDTSSEFDFDEIEERRGIATNSDGESDVDDALPGDEVAADDEHPVDTDNMLKLIRRGIPAPGARQGSIVISAGHSMLLKSLKGLGMGFICHFCQQAYRREYNYKRHLKDGECTRETVEQYVEHGFRPKAGLFEDLMTTFPGEIRIEGYDHRYDCGVKVPRSHEIYLTKAEIHPTECIVWDVETFGAPSTIHATERTEYVEEHIPYAIGIAANFGDCEYKCLVNRDPVELTKEFLEHLMLLREEFCRARHTPAMQALEVFLDGKVRDAKKARKLLRKPQQGLGQVCMKDYFHSQHADLEQAVKDGNQQLEQAKLDILERGIRDHARTAYLAGQLYVYQSLQSRLKRFCRNLPCIGFNSARFDMNVLRKYLFPLAIELDLYDSQTSTIIRKGSSYQYVGFKGLAFLDICNYTAPGFSYAQFLRDLGQEESKGIFCYDAVHSFDDLTAHRDEFPSYDQFYSELKGNVAQDVYEETKALWDDKGWTSLMELLRYYLERDVVPFAKAVTKFQQVWADKVDVNLFNDGVISVPGIALRFLFSAKDPYGHFYTFGEEYKKYHEEFRSNGITGGLSMVMSTLKIMESVRNIMLFQVFNRDQHVGETTLKPDGKITRSICGLDANALYLFAIAQTMPAHLPLLITPTDPGVSDGFEEYCKAVRWTRDKDFPDGYSAEQQEADRAQFEQLSQAFKQTSFSMTEMFKYKRLEVLYVDAQHLAWVRRTRLAQEALTGEFVAECSVRIPPQRHHMAGGQVPVGNIWGSVFRLDGVIGEDVYEFDGCRAHGHECLWRNNRQQTVQQERDMRLQQIRTALKQLTLEVVFGPDHVHKLNHCDLRRELGNPNSIYAEMQARHDPHDEVGRTLSSARRLTGTVLERRIQDGSMNGFAKVCLQIPHHDRTARLRCEILPPIIKNYSVSTANFLLEPGRQKIVDSGVLDTPRRMLIPSFYGRDVVLELGYIKYLLEHGARITKLHWVMQFSHQRPFEIIKDKIWAGRAFAKDVGQPLLEMVWKLLGNSLYGKCITRVERHMNIALHTTTDVSTAVNSHRFKQLDYIGRDVYEVTSKKSKVVFDLPLTIGCAVYANAKTHLLAFAYEHLDRYLDREDFTLTHCDTDSLYFALSTNSIADAVRLKEETNPGVLDEYNDPTNPWGDKRLVVQDDDDYMERMRPGKYKYEVRNATHAVVLAPKTNAYVVPGGEKITCKGAAKKQPHNRELLSHERMMGVLRTGEPITVTNVGLVVKHGGIMKVRQSRDAITDMMLKAEMLADGVSVTPFVNDWEATPQPTAGPPNPGNRSNGSTPEPGPRPQAIATPRSNHHQAPILNIPLPDRPALDPDIPSTSRLEYRPDPPEPPQKRRRTQ